MKLRATAALSLLALAGCGGETTPAPTPGACVPPRAAWDATVRPLVAQHCGTCHGATPTAGAPYTLLDYDALLRPVSGRRPVDRIAARLGEGTMPPPSAPTVDDDARRAIVGWASCGAQTVTPGGGVRASAPVFRSPAQAPAGLEHFDLTARNQAVGPDVTDLYQCFVFDAPVTADRFIRRFELLLDEARVVHHIVLLRDPDRSGPASDFQCTSMPQSSEYLYAWAPGQSAFEFPDGGLRVRPGQRFILQLHYNNSGRVADVTDSSGVRVYHGAPQGTEYGMVAYGPVGFQIPARSTGSAQSGCTVHAASRLLAGMPHMHGIGTGFTQEIVRAGGAREPLVTLTNWRFETQLFYDLAKTLNPGDRITTRCDYNNTGSTAVRSGSGTRDEMCFNFAYVSPPPPARYCDEGTSDPNTVTYAPGTCARPNAPADLPLIDGSLRVGEAPAATGGALPAGRWVLSGHALLLNSLNAGIGEIDLTRSSLRSRGQAWTEGGRFTADVLSGLHVQIGSVPLDRAIPVSLSGTHGDTGQSPLSLAADCGAMGSVPLAYSVAGDELTVWTPPQMTGPVRIVSEYRFRRAM
ncbi:MAG: hypothetical protein U0324_34010 [Polyangiales bacterium]